MDLRGRRVVVVGAGASGLAAARLLAARGARPVLVDGDAAAAQRPGVAELARTGVVTDCGPHRPGQAAGADFVVVSPGVPSTAPPVAEARAAGVPILGEMELGARLAQGRLLGITGSNGKSTTTTLAARMLAAAGLDVRAGGNLGTPLCTAVLAGDTAETVHCLEVSSFQCETLDLARFAVVALLNISADHLDRYPGFEDYAAAKARLLDQQDAGGAAVLSADDARCRALSARTRGRLGWFSLAALPGRGVRFDAARGVAVSTLGGSEEVIFDGGDLWTTAPHHRQNALAAAAVVLEAGAPVAAVRAGLVGFAGLPHRGEEIRPLGAPRFVNDSKATNVDAAVRSIEGAGRGVVVILGGRHKGGSVVAVADAVVAAQGQAVLIGEAAPVFREALAGRAPVVDAASLGEAVAVAARLAGPAGVVLLAPACASFDMFRNYEHRGESFRAEVLARFAARRAADVGRAGEESGAPPSRGCAA